MYDSKSQRLPLPHRLLAALMRAMPADIRRIDMVWRKLYDRIGGGGFTEDPELDRRWPPGLQEPIRGKRHGLLMFLNLQDWLDRRTYFRGEYYQESVCRLFEHVLSPGDQFLDVGANVGMTTLVAAALVGPSGKGYSFEPNPRAYERLAQHLEANKLGHVEAQPVALADREAAVSLVVPGNHMGLGTLVPEADVEGTRVGAKAMPGDAFADRLDPSKTTLVKIDVEGYEVHALHGLTEILSWPETVLAIEVTDGMLRRAGHSAVELHDFLRDRGYNAWSIRMRAGRWQRRVELRRLEGALEHPQYDAVFAQPGSDVFRNRLEPLVAPAGPGASS